MGICRWGTRIRIKLYIDIRFISLAFKKISDKRMWKEAFNDYFNDTRYGYETADKYIVENKKKLLKGFTSRKIKLVKKSCKADAFDDDRTVPILISVIKNEQEKLPVFFMHYRKLGIKKFIMIDNASSDGTMKFLMKQRDAEVYRVSEKFQSSVKEGWINQIFALYGFHRWYLIVDADELITWPQLGKKTLHDMVIFLQKNRQYRPMALMLDMYPDAFLYQRQSGNILKKCCYFDKDTYYWIEGCLVDILSGGPRKRVLGSEVWLSKTPLIYLKPKEFLCNAHYMYPYLRNDKRECPLVLLHYKFAYKSSYKEMKEYVKKGMDVNRISESEVCLGRRIMFFGENSICLDKMWKLCEVPYIVDVFKNSDERNLQDDEV